ncbi:MAG TPA: hypothetical protein VIL20_19310 [Sandaracinaceae bacterium]
MTDRHASQLRLAGSVVLTAVFHAPAFFDPDATGFGDWQQIHHAWEVGVVAVRRWGEWPLWNPHHCGGVTMLGNPESQHWSPFFPLALVFSSTHVLKLVLVLHAWLGLVGAYRLARREHGLSTFAASIAAVGFSMSGFFAWQMAGGHFTFVSFYLAPWLLLAFRASIRDLRWVAAVALLLALSVAEGGTYPFPYFVLLLAFDGAVVALGSRRDVLLRARRVLAAGLGAGLLAALVGAIRFLPIVRTLELYPRDEPSYDRMYLHEMVDVWTRYDFPWRHPDHPFVWNEYTAFVGWPLFSLGLLGIVVALRRRRFGLVAGLAIFVALMLGNRGPWAPWELLHSLPVYDSLKVPSRFSVFATLYLALLAGLAIDELRRGARRLGSVLGDRGLRIAGRTAKALTFLLAAGPAVAFGAVTHARWDGPPVSGEPADRFHLVPAAHYQYEIASLPRRNLGTPACYIGSMRWDISRRLWVGDRPQVRVQGPGEVVRARRTNHTVEADVRMEGPGRVLFNQNYHPDWTERSGFRVANDGGLLAVDVPAGAHRLKVRYEPATLFTAANLSLLGLVVCGLVLFRPRRARLVGGR